MSFFLNNKTFMLISTLKDIKNEGVNVCFIKGNRQVSNKNVKSNNVFITIEQPKLIRNIRV